MRVAALMPALDEEDSLPSVLAGLTGRGLESIVVVDNGSTDRTAEVARAGGAVVVHCPRRGYGSACLAGLDWLALDPPDVVVFLDADGADDPDDLASLLSPLLDGRAEMVIGSRVAGRADDGALTPVQRFGNALSCRLIAWAWGVRFTDLGPFRAVRWETLELLGMRDPDFGWTVEMQARAARLGLRSVEVPVRYRRRVAGRSKVAGTVRGSVRAGVKILYTIGREFVRGGP
jgi:glycosyltransferase involved in cell wall biosynthesis